jgi:hypothetical protein
MITLEDVHVSGPVRPRSVEFFIRTVPPTDQFTSTIISANGAPPYFDQPYAKFRTDPAQFHKGVRGSRISTRCGGFSARQGFTELVITTTAGSSGAYLTSESIDYKVGDSHYTLRLELGLAQCGTARAISTLCAAAD